MLGNAYSEYLRHRRNSAAAEEKAWSFFHTRTLPVSKGGDKGTNFNSSERFPIRKPNAAPTPLRIILAAFKIRL